MPSRLRVKIGDVVLLLVSKNRALRLKPNNQYKSFLSRRSPDVVLHCQRNPVPAGFKNPCQKVVFDTSSYWSLYRSNGKRILQTLNRLAVLSPDFTSGQVYLTRNRQDFPLTFPLWAPFLCFKSVIF